MPLAADLILHHAHPLVTLRGAPGPRAGRAMSEPAAIPDGAVAIKRGRILAVGAGRAVLREFRAPKKVDAEGRLVTPGLVDAHTHLVFAGSRENEFEMRIRGASYMDIAKTGGGILSTVDRVRATPLDTLVRETRLRVRQMLRHGTTTAEAKSGYGLSTEHEIKCLEAVARVARAEDIDLVPTFMGAHEVPREFAGRRPDYVDAVIRDMIPAVGARRLARFCDVFCEVGVFSVEESRRILLAARRAGMAPKLHAEEFKASGGAELAAEIGAVSCDHLMAVTDRGIRALKAKGVIAVLLPATSFFLASSRFAPARRFIEEGVPVALGTDYNPGSSPTFNMQLVMTLACTQLRMTPAEALCAATLNAAYAVGEGDAAGSIEPGKRADLIVWDAPDVNYLPYAFGANLARTVIKAGKVV
ncbi:MAG: imidazolonepropionase [Planctomycetes bacterium]|nr:imidazolonepropionase [Planctomycetota bacterium]